MPQYPRVGLSGGYGTKGPQGLVLVKGAGFAVVSRFRSSLKPVSIYFQVVQAAVLPVPAMPLCVPVNKVIIWY